MRIRDRIALAWRGYWAESCHEALQPWRAAREDWREFRAEMNEARHWDLIIRRKITGKQDPTRKDVRRAMRDYRRDES
jgi:hypothetical protein